MSTNVLITGKLHSSAIEAFKNSDKLNVTYMPDAKLDEFRSVLEKSQVLVSRSETTVDKELIDAAPQLKVVARAAVGIGNIDVEYATERGILVLNTPGKNTNSAAELSLALILGMLRKVPEAQNKVKDGGWERHKFTGLELRNKKVGIVGLGNVGHRVAKFCKGFDAEVYAYDPYISPNVFDRHKAKPCKSLKELAAQVDILTLHVPKNKETTGMINSEILDVMTDGSYLVNAARGGIIAENDLLKALENGKLAGAAIDTFETEPNPLPELVSHPKVYCTPHIGASTEEAQRAIGQTVFEQVLKAADGGVVDFPVNLPEIGVVVDKPILKTYSVLAEKLGSLVGQIINFNPKSVELHYRGDIAELDNSLLKLSFMKGYGNQVSDDFVSLVNASAHFEKQGIEISEAHDPQFTGYKSALKVHVYGPEGTELTVGGVVFDSRYIRISLINDFYFEVEPKGPMVIVENKDVPGVIGNIGHFFSDNGINISSFALSRNIKGGKAMSILCIDNELKKKELSGLLKIDNIINARSMTL